MIRTYFNTLGAHLVIGTGPLGRATAIALQKQGHSVILANRSGRLTDAPKYITLTAADLSSPGELSKRFEGVAAIYFCAQPQYHRWAQEFPALQDSVINLAKETSARLVVAENLYAYGRVNQAMTESLPLQPNTRKGRIRADMHTRLIRAHEAGEIKVTIARGSDFFGPYVQGSAVGARVFQAITAGKPAEVYGNIDTLHSYTFVEDFGVALAILGTNPRSLGQVWHVPNATTVSTRTFLEIAFKLAEQKSKFRKLGAFQLNVAGLFISQAKEMVEMLYEFEHPFTVDHQKFAGAFGDISTPLESALAKTIEWTQAQKK